MLLFAAAGACAVSAEDTYTPWVKGTSSITPGEIGYYSVTSAVELADILTQLNAITGSEKVVTTVSIKLLANNGQPTVYDYKAETGQNLRTVSDAFNTSITTLGESKNWQTEYRKSENQIFTIMQFPTWNGGHGHGPVGQEGNPNNISRIYHQVPQNQVQLIGETDASGNPLVTLHGLIHVVGMGAADDGFEPEPGVKVDVKTGIKSLRFDSSYGIVDDGDQYSIKASSASFTVDIDNCRFINTTHVLTGGNGQSKVYNVTINDCVFDKGGCISGYIGQSGTLTIKNTTNIAAGGDVGTSISIESGFINIQGEPLSVFNVENCSYSSYGYGIRLNYGTGTVNDSIITVAKTKADTDYKTGVFCIRASNSNHKATLIFDNCTLSIPASEEAGYARLFSSNTDATVELKDTTLDSRVQIQGPFGQNNNVLVYPAAKIGEVTYNSLAEAVAAVENSQTIELLRDIELSASIVRENLPNHTIDGCGHIITILSGVNYGKGCFVFGDDAGEVDLTKHFILKNTSFEGPENGQVTATVIVRPQSCNMDIDGCSFKWCNSSNAGYSSIISPVGAVLTIKNTVFDNNTCTDTAGAASCASCITDGIGGTGSLLNIDNCSFTSNTVTGGNGLILSYENAGVTITNSTFKNNAVSVAGSGESVAVLSLGSPADVSGCLFDTNSISGNDDKCGVVTFGGTSANSKVTGNVFKDNTLTKTSGAKATVYVSKDNINLNENYWEDGTAPSVGDGEDIYIKSGMSAVYDVFATSYTQNSGNYGVTTVFPVVAALYKGEEKLGEYGSIKSAAAAWNAITQAGDYTIVIEDGTYTENCIIFKQQHNGVNLEIKPKNDGAVTMKTNTTDAYRMIFCVAGDGNSYKGGSVDIEGIQFDLTAYNSTLNGAWAVYFAAKDTGVQDPELPTGYGGRYVHDVTIKNCTVVGADAVAMLVHTESGSSPSGIVVENCTASNIGYLAGGYFQDYDGRIGLTVKDCVEVEGNNKCFINNQIALATTIVENCTVKTYADYCIRVLSENNRVSNLFVNNSTITTTYDGDNKAGIIVTRDNSKASNPLNVTIVNPVFTRTSEKDTVYDVLSDGSDKGNNHTLIWLNGEQITAGLKDGGSYLTKGNGWNIPGPVAKIGENTYLTLEAAVNAAAEGQTIELLADITLTDTQIIPGKSITLDLAGYNLTGPVDKVAVSVTGNGKTLTLSDTGSTKGKIVNQNSAGYTLFITTEATGGVVFSDIESPFTLSVKNSTKAGYYTDGISQSNFESIKHSYVTLLKDVGTPGLHTSTMSVIYLRDGVTFDGDGHTMYVAPSNDNTHALGVTDESESNKVTIKNLTINMTSDSAGSGHCINILNSTVDLIDVTVTGSKKAGVNVNGKSSSGTSGAVVTAQNLHTKNNAWGGVGVDSRNKEGV
ncbi:MAG TPA: hypothetical protein O0X42_01475, partial [Methanocorpusculum sp.]|nr:hypothetical protein [Methanocorpusculum sp.]